MLEKTITVSPEPFRISALFRELQDIAGEAVIPWHATGPELEKLGLMWVVVRYEVNLERQLIPGETLTLCTWASPVRHRLSQRNYLAYDRNGSCVLRGAGIWALADRKTRAMVDPEERHVEFRAETNGKEPPRPGTPKKLALQSRAAYTVTEEVLDMNGHMNNTRYFDLAQDLAGETFPVQELRQVRAVYSSEARLGDMLSVEWGQDGKEWYFTGEKNGETCFQISWQTI
ncbi:MAG: hypothetical protein IJV40_12570 [Oscillospiraceae bacterium]|nr:hypothetical protein [Oscillospiraceae bacterium]